MSVGRHVTELCFAASAMTIQLLKCFQNALLVNADGGHSFEHTSGQNKLKQFNAIFQRDLKRRCFTFQTCGYKNDDTETSKKCPDIFPTCP